MIWVIWANFTLKRVRKKSLLYKRVEKMTHITHTLLFAYDYSN